MHKTNLIFACAFADISCNHRDLDNGHAKSTLADDTTFFTEMEELPIGPEIIFKPTVEYTHKRGKVVVTVVVDTFGNPTDARVIVSSDSLLNEPAIRTARRYRFQPASFFGKKESTTVALTIDFDSIRIE